MKRPRRQQPDMPVDLTTLIAAWVDDVEQLARDDETRLPPVPVGNLAGQLRRRRTPRAASAILAASAALLSASGVAAAVTGDPLAVYGSAIHSLLGGQQSAPAAGPAAGQDETAEPDQRKPGLSTGGTHDSDAVPVVAPQTSDLDTPSAVSSEPTPTSSLNTPDPLAGTDPGVPTTPLGSPSPTPSATVTTPDGQGEPPAPAAPSDSSDPSLPAAVITPQGADESVPTPSLPADPPSTSTSSEGSSPSTGSSRSDGSSPPAGPTGSTGSTPATP